MNKFRKFGLGLFTSVCLLTLSIAVSAQKVNPIGAFETNFIVLSEIETDNPGGENNACNYIELRGDSSAFIGSDTYLVEFEGDIGAAGEADFVRNVSGEFFGTNGILTIAGTGTCGTRNYTADGGTLIQDSGASLEQGTITFMIIQTVAPAARAIGVGGPPIVEGTDYDIGNTGTLGLPSDSNVIDAVGWTDGGGTDIVYSTNITPSTGTPMAATRNFSNSSTTTASAWFADDLAGSSVDGVLYDQTNFGPPFVVDFLTPGAQNLAPTAALGTISGRVRTSGGLGIKHAVMMLTGGNLQEPIYATTNQFGNYKFEDVGVGQDYVLQIMSGRYMFKNPSRVISLSESISNADFVGESIGK